MKRASVRLFASALVGAALLSALICREVRAEDHAVSSNLHSELSLGGGVRSESAGLSKSVNGVGSFDGSLTYFGTRQVDDQQVNGVFQVGAQDSVSASGLSNTGNAQLFASGGISFFSVFAGLEAASHQLYQTALAKAGWAWPAVNGRNYQVIPYIGGIVGVGQGQGENPAAGQSAMNLSGTAVGARLIVHVPRSINIEATLEADYLGGKQNAYPFIHAGRNLADINLSYPVVQVPSIASDVTLGAKATYEQYSGTSFRDPAAGQALITLGLTNLR